MISIHACTSPQNIRIENHKITTGQYWNDPVYRAIANKRIEGEEGEYCRVRPAQMAHHDNEDSYKSKEEYYRPENMTPACHACHANYRRGYEVCPVCLENGEVHYMRRGAESCYRHRQSTGPYRPKPRRPSRHPCGRHAGSQQCRRDGKVVICPRSPAKAEGCDYFRKRVEARA